MECVEPVNQAKGVVSKGQRFVRIGKNNREVWGPPSCRQPVHETLIAEMVTVSFPQRYDWVLGEP